LNHQKPLKLIVSIFPHHSPTISNSPLINDQFFFHITTIAQIKKQQIQIYAISPQTITREKKRARASRKRRGPRFSAARGLI
jgi:hypothetical protein